jgi:hypothetical protein
VGFERRGKSPQRHRDTERNRRGTEKKMRGEEAEKRRRKGGGRRRWEMAWGSSHRSAIWFSEG